MIIQKRRKTQKKRFRVKCLLLGLVLLGSLFAADAQLRPAITSVAQSQAGLYATQVIQETVHDQVSALELDYGDLVRLTYSDQGSVTSLQTDMLAMSKFQSTVTGSIIQRILLFDEQRMELPLGTLTGNPFLSGRGPEVEIKLIPSSFVQTQVHNVFETEGINQTRHQVLLNVKVDVQAVLPGVTRTEIWERSGTGIAGIPAEMVMEVEDLVEAALVGFDRREAVTIPSLPDAADWQALMTARARLAPNLSRQRPAERYLG